MNRRRSARVARDRVATASFWKTQHGFPLPRKKKFMSTRFAPVETSLKSVLVASDFTEASSKPLRHAISIARHYHARFYLAHVVSSVGFTIAGADGGHHVRQLDRKSTRLNSSHRCNSYAV